MIGISGSPRTIAGSAMSAYDEQPWLGSPKTSPGTSLRRELRARERHQAEA